MRFALFKEVPKRQRRKKRKLNHGSAAERKGSESGDDDESEEEEDEGPPQRMGLPGNGQQVRVAAREPEDLIWGDQSQDVDMTDGDSAPAEESDEVRKNSRYNLLYLYFGQH